MVEATDSWSTPTISSVAATKSVAHVRHQVSQSRVLQAQLRRSPEEVVIAAEQRVVKLEAALQALGDEDSAETKDLQERLKKASVAAKGISVSLQLEQCQQFVGRCEKRLSALDAERAKEAERLEEGKANLERLR